VVEQCCVSPAAGLPSRRNHRTAVRSAAVSFALSVPWYVCRSWSTCAVCSGHGLLRWRRDEAGRETARARGKRDVAGRGGPGKPVVADRAPPRFYFRLKPRRTITLSPAGPEEKADPAARTLAPSRERQGDARNFPPGRGRSRRNSASTSLTCDAARAAVRKKAHRGPKSAIRCNGARGTARGGHGDGDGGTLKGEAVPASCQWVPSCPPCVRQWFAADHGLKPVAGFGFGWKDSDVGSRLPQTIFVTSRTRRRPTRHVRMLLLLFRAVTRPQVTVHLDESAGPRSTRRAPHHLESERVHVGRLMRDRPRKWAQMPAPHGGARSARPRTSPSSRTTALG